VASPQTENGYTKIANELLEALARTNFSPYQRRVLDVIMRKTYGYGKKADKVPGSQIAEMTGIYKSNVSRALKELRGRNIVISTDNKLRINKDYSQWDKLSVEITKKDEKVISTDRKVISTDNEKLSVEMDSKEKRKLQKKKNHASVVFSGKEKEIIERFCKTLGSHFKMKFWPWVQQSINSGCHSEHIIYCLEQLWQYRESTKDPWPYLNHVMQITHQNANEHDAITQHEQRKKEEQDAERALRALVR